MPIEDLNKELRSQLERLIALKDRLDSKANNMITMSGTIATLFMGFGVFLLSDVDIEKNLCLSIFAGLILSAEVILTIFTIKYSLDSYKLRDYYHPIGYKAFYDEDNDRVDEDVLNDFAQRNTVEIENHLAKEYVKSIKSYEQQNKKQTIGINLAQRSFLIAIILIPIFAVVLLLLKFLP